MAFRSDVAIHQCCLPSNPLLHPHPQGEEDGGPRKQYYEIDITVAKVGMKCHYEYDDEEYADDCIIEKIKKTGPKNKRIQIKYTQHEEEEGEEPTQCLVTKHVGINKLFDFRAPITEEEIADAEIGASAIISDAEGVDEDKAGDETE